MPPGCARPRGARSAFHCPRLGSLRRPRRGESSMPHSLGWQSRRARQCTRGTPSAQSARRRRQSRSMSSGSARSTARYVIAADGMWSATRKALGIGEAGYLGEWHAFRQYARNVDGPAAERLIVWFEPELLPGYMWSFPLPNGRVNIGFGVQRDGVRRVQDMKQRMGRPVAPATRRRGARREIRARGSPYRLADPRGDRPGNVVGGSCVLCR